MGATGHVLMVAAENDALPGGKVGGIGDVVRDVAPLVAERGIGVSVVIPAYGTFAGAPGARRLATTTFEFGGGLERADLYEVPGKVAHRGVRHLVLDHPAFGVCGPGRIYCEDPPTRPFATDATKFALFSAAVVAALRAGAFGSANVVHLHDWHTTLVAVLLGHHHAGAPLRDVHRVLTIHNLALQGVRPLAGDPSSFETWFPGFDCPRRVIADPRWPDCVNPMAAGVRLAHAIHAVSPSYAEEILSPNALDRRGFHGGEGLEADLADARDEGRLFGILNGCEYPGPTHAGAADWGALVGTMQRELLRWAGMTPSLASAHFIAQARLAELSSRRPDLVVTSVSRVTEQKFRLLREPASDGRPALEHVLERLAGRGIYLLLGSGDPGYEQFFTETAARHRSLVFLCGYSDELARALYAHGDLFLMPSSFEPCGIGQMLAMRAGQPCLVHHVGGLRDTVRDGISGFSFGGDTLTDQADALGARFHAALEMYEQEPERYRRIRRSAQAARFEWEASVDAYLRDLYRVRAGAPAP